MGMEAAVIGTQIVGVVGHGHICPDVAADTYGPVEVFAPVGDLAAADVANGAAVVVLAQQGLTEAGLFFGEHVGLAAVAYHDAELLLVVHFGDVGNGESGVGPAFGTAVGTVVAEARTLAVEVAYGGGIGRSVIPFDGNIGDVGRHSRYVVLEVVDVAEAMGTVEVVGNGIVHGRVGMTIAIVATSASVNTGYHDGAVKERRVGKGVLLIHQRLLDLRYQLRHVLCRETAVMAVGDVVGRGPRAVIEVCDMLVLDSALKCRNLLNVANQQDKGRCGIGGCGVDVLTLQIILNGGRGGAYGGIVGIDDVGQEAFAFLPLHEGVHLAAEHAVGHYEVAHRCCGAYRFRVETVQCVGAAIESRAVVAVEEFFGAIDVGVAVAYSDSCLTAYNKHSAYGIVTHRRELEAGQIAVTGYADRLDKGLTFADKGIP